MASAAQYTSSITLTKSDYPTLGEAMSATPEEKELCLCAIYEKLLTFNLQHTWTRDEHPKTAPLSTHIVLNIKRSSDGSVERFKARIVSGWNFQVFGDNYLETNDPVASFTVVRVILYIALLFDMSMVQLDVKTAFLNGIIE